MILVGFNGSWVLYSQRKNGQFLSPPSDEVNLSPKARYKVMYILMWANPWQALIGTDEVILKLLAFVFQWSEIESFASVNHSWIRSEHIHVQLLCELFIKSFMDVSGHVSFPLNYSSWGLQIASCINSSGEIAMAVCSCFLLGRQRLLRIDHDSWQLRGRNHNFFHRTEMYTILSTLNVAFTPSHIPLSILSSPSHLSKQLVKNYSILIEQMVIAHLRIREHKV